MAECLGNSSQLGAGENPSLGRNAVASSSIGSVNFSNDKIHCSGQGGKMECQSRRNEADCKKKNLGTNEDDRLDVRC